MSHANLHMICPLLLLLPLSATARDPRCPDLEHLSTRKDVTFKSRSACVNAGQLSIHEERFRKRFWDKANFTRAAAVCHEPMQDEHACEKLVGAMTLKDPQKGHEKRTRALSPWEYCIHRDNNRFPRDISIAVCLCHGCIIGQREDQSYNSVPVCSPVTVLWRTRCPHDPEKYLVRKELINVPVACTCVRPIYTK